jgi:hypothetical protein
MHVAAIWVVTVSACVQPFQLMLRSVTYEVQASNGDHNSCAVSVTTRSTVTTFLVLSPFTYISCRFVHCKRPPSLFDLIEICYACFRWQLNFYLLLCHHKLTEMQRLLHSKQASLHYCFLPQHSSWNLTHNEARCRNARGGYTKKIKKTRSWKTE